MGILIRSSRTLWRALGSTRLAAILLAALLFVILLASLFPQMPTSPAAREPWLGAVVLRYGRATDWLHALGLFRAYRTPWFLVLLAALLLNTLACTVQRLPHLWRLLTRPPVVARPEAFYRGFAHHAQWPVASVEDGLLAAQSTLSQHHYRSRVERTESATCAHVYAERSRWTQSCTVVSHLGALFLAIAVVARPALGWQEASVLLPAGQVVAVGHGTSLTAMAGEPEIDYYPDGQPRDYRVSLTVKAGDSPAMMRMVHINRPMTFRGVAFHLQGTGPAAHVASPEGAFDLAFTDSQVQEVALSRPGLTLQVAYLGEDETLFVEAFAADGILLGSGKVSDGQQIEVQGLPITFSLGRYTIWQVSRDPTFGLAVGAAGILLAGMLGSLWVSYRRLWLRVSGEKVQMVGAGDLGDFEELASEMASACKSSANLASGLPAAEPLGRVSAPLEAETDG